MNTTDMHTDKMTDIKATTISAELESLDKLTRETGGLFNSIELRLTGDGKPTKPNEPEEGFNGIYEMVAVLARRVSAINGRIENLQTIIGV